MTRQVARSVPTLLAARRRRAAGGVILSAFCAVSVSSCVNDRITGSRSPVNLVIERIGAARGGTTDDPIPTFLQSDVLTHGGVFEDTARVTARIAFKDPGTAEQPSAPTSANFITINRYRIRYIRSDGRNTPGVDVPFPWDGAFTMTVMAGPQTGEFTLVRGAAKIEPPLIALRNGGGQFIINTIAEITFYGHDQTGAEVVAFGTIGVNFADWADPET